MVEIIHANRYISLVNLWENFNEAFADTKTTEHRDRICRSLISQQVERWPSVSDVKLDVVELD